MSFQFVHTKVMIAPSAPPWPEADALVLPTNDYLWMATGPALDVKQMTGDEIELAAVRQGPVDPGQGRGDRRRRRFHSRASSMPPSWVRTWRPRQKRRPWRSPRRCGSPWRGGGPAS